MAGREGLIDTAVKRRDWVYPEEAYQGTGGRKVAYDRSVRNAGGSIVQFLFGEDGMDACSIEQQFFPRCLSTPTPPSPSNTS
jgi:DNA-directed RNA polymerase beta' subunit